MILEQNFTFSPKMLEPPSPIQSVVRAKYGWDGRDPQQWQVKVAYLVGFGRRAMTKKTQKHIQFWKNPD